MTSQHPPPAPRRTIPDDDVAIAAAVTQLLEQRGEGVVDLAHFTRISVASLYRKLAGQQSWKAADVGAIARHYRVVPGRLFEGHVDGDNAGRSGDQPAAPPPAPEVDLLHPFGAVAG